MLNHRKNSYATISNQLATMNDLQILDLISTKEGFKSSIGGQSCVTYLSGNSIFVKKLPLTDIERRPENIQSTANLFQLSPSYHYGVGVPQIDLDPKFQDEHLNSANLPLRSFL